jgi:hypothetical protein
MENTNRAGHKLLFKGEEYRLDQILSLAKSGPPIEVKLEELNQLGIQKIASEPEEQPYVARHCPPLQEYQEHPPVFFKQEGKFTVLLGHEQVRKACLKSGAIVVKGKLISGPQLKKARIEKPINVAEVVKEKVQETTSFNAPRITQDRRSPQTERRGLPNTQRPPSAGPRRYGSNETITRRGPRGS